MTDDSPKLTNADIITSLQKAGYHIADLSGLSPEERQEIIDKVVADMQVPEGFDIEETEETEDESPGSTVQDSYIEKVKASSHKLEELFDIEEGTTMIPYKERVPVELVQCTSYDQKDTEIETQLHGIFEAAMEAYENSIEDSEGVEPKYRARSREVAAQFLNTALAAIKEKGHNKGNKDKIERASNADEGGGKTTNNFFMDRNELLKMMKAEKEQAEKEIMDGEYKEVGDEKEG